MKQARSCPSAIAAALATTLLLAASPALPSDSEASSRRVPESAGSSIPPDEYEKEMHDAFTRVQEWNASPKLSLYPPATLDSLLAAEAGLSTAARIGLWARRFAADTLSAYRFGLHEGGYVSEGLLVSDHAQDCVSLLYRCCELAQARDAADALRIALATRFAGAPLDSLVDESGRVDYDRPEHLDYSLDMVRSGYWGREITTSLSGARPDAEGTARFAPGSFSYVPGESLRAGELREGDLVWFVLNPAVDGARRLREEQGVAIGHLGIVIMDKGEPWLVHAAASPLKGRYEGGRVVSVPLAEYLRRVERFRGVIVTRFEGGGAPDARGGAGPGGGAKAR